MRGVYACTYEERAQMSYACKYYKTNLLVYPKVSMCHNRPFVRQIKCRASQ